MHAKPKSILTGLLLLGLLLAPLAPAAAHPPAELPEIGECGPPGPPQGPCITNTDIVLALYEAFAVGDLDTILAIIHPDVIWIESEGIPYGGTFIGRDAVFEGVFGKIAEEWDDFTATSETVFEGDGNRVVVLGRDSGTYKATGKSMVAPAASIWTLNDAGQVILFQQYIDTQAVNSATIP
jgi:ketosteroid isomerase-like protein